MKLFKRSRQAALVVLLTALVGAWIVSAQNSGDALERGFQNPPDSAKPRVWWHWMNGNITKEGIKADLEWMKRVGIGGFQNFDAALNTPQVVEKRLVYMTPEWKDAFKYAATLADQLGLEMAIAGSPGWSESGGPWVPPAQAMKKFVWTETRVQGGRPFTGALPKPPSTTGQFQNIAATPRGAFGGGTPPPPLPEFYADSAVIAYRAPDGDLSMAELQPKVTSSGGQFDLAALTDGDLAKSANGSRAHPCDGGRRSWRSWRRRSQRNPAGIGQRRRAISHRCRNSARRAHRRVSGGHSQLLPRHIQDTAIVGGTWRRRWRVRTTPGSRHAGTSSRGADCRICSTHRAARESLRRQGGLLRRHQPLCFRDVRHAGTGQRPQDGRD